MALNRNKPFGEVYGVGATHKYEQGGQLFNDQGLQVDDTGKILEVIVDKDDSGYKTIPEIKDALDELGVEYDKSMKRDDLLALLAEENNVVD